MKAVPGVLAAHPRGGHDGAVMFDAHCGIPPATLIQLASAIKAYDVLFIEEPAVPGNIEVFKRLKQSINIPLAVGEQQTRPVSADSDRQVTGTKKRNPLEASRNPATQGKQGRKTKARAGEEPLLAPWKPE